MPIKKIPNHIHIMEHDDVVSLFTTSRKNHFTSEAKLYEALESGVRSLNVDFEVHLTTHPFIGVHVSYGLSGGATARKDEIKKIVDQVLNNQLRQT